MNNRSELICDTNHLQDAYELSNLCWNDYSTNKSLPCFPKSFEEHFGVKLFALLVTLLNCGIGVGGNLLTLCAIPYAIYKKR